MSTDYKEVEQEATDKEPQAMAKPRTIRLLLAFDGTAYCGWQRQKGKPSIQQTVEEQLVRLAGSPVVLHGAGRTDSGVHALGMVAHFKTGCTVPAIAFMGGLNSMLPKDIRVLEASEAANDFHSRYNALAKTYRYDFFTGSLQLPCQRHTVAHLPGKFSLEPACQALHYLLGKHDFSSFEGSGSRDRKRTGGRGAVRTILAADCIPARNMVPNTWSIYLTGDGFLRHMVRNIAGTLFPAGCGKLSGADVREILQARDRSRAGATAPACGLHLVKVWYDALPGPLDHQNLP